MLLQNLYAINSFLTDNVGYISGFIGIFSFIKFFVCKKNFRESLSYRYNYHYDPLCSREHCYGRLYRGS